MDEDPAGVSGHGRGQAMTPDEFRSGMKQIAMEYLAIGEKHARFWRILAIACALPSGVLLAARDWVPGAIFFALTWHAVWMRSFVMRYAIRRRSEALES